MATCLIALGGNLGDRAANLQAALDRLSATPGVSALSASPFLETVPVGGPADQPAFLNAAARFDCELSPLAITRRLHEIESALGRVREVRWDARTVDLDLLLYDDQAVGTDDLQLPHPRMTFRRFVLEPAAQIAGGMRHPGSGWTIEEHLQHLLNSLPLVSLWGGGGSLRTELAADVARQLDGSAIASATQASFSDPHSNQSAGWLIAISGPELADCSTTLPNDTFRRSPAGSAWPADKFGPRPRLLVVLDDSESDVQEDAKAGGSPISIELASALTRLPGGGILRLNAARPRADIVAEIVAAARATE